MREESSAWLAPMLEEADRRYIDVQALLRQAAMAAAEADPHPSVDAATQQASQMPGARALAVDWIRLGALLRHELGWDDTYPPLPDFPELRDTP